MKKVFLIGLAFCTFGSQSQNTKTAETKSENKIVADYLTGKQSKAALQQQPFNKWFDPGFEGYRPDAETISGLKKQISGVGIVVFMGTWCDDSKEQVPHFYQILKQIGFDEKRVTLIAVDREKKTPERFEQGLDIINVPTFIFYKNGKELHRIVETPVENLEKDMLKILSGQPYKHQYEK